MRNYSAKIGRLSATRLSCAAAHIAVLLTILMGPLYVSQTTVAQTTVAQSATPSAANDTHLYFFTSLGCAPCEVVKPALAKLDAAGYPVTTVDIRQRPDWATHFRVDRTPTVIMVRNQQIVGRHAGIIGHQELLQWFATSGYKPSAGRTQVAASAPRSTQSSAVAKPIAPSNLSSASAASSSASISSAASAASPEIALTRRQSSDFTSPTMHQGTPTPASDGERNALNATVKIKVEDPEGISYATGTVVHSHGRESLVVTCGHVFRDSQGTGEISAEYGFASGKISVAQGELIFFDADARDIALLVLKTNGDTIPAADIASKKTNVNIGQDSFSIGCDHGQSPTIRHTRIKNRAAYDGSIKYDIFGRPVDGRSGGGLFSNDGKLIGVCNAAVVDVDEGIYTALDTIHWQMAYTNLAHLFDTSNSSSVAASQAPTPSKPSTTKPTLSQPSTSGSAALASSSLLGPQTPGSNAGNVGDSNRPQVAFPRSTNRSRGPSSLVALRDDDRTTDRQQDSHSNSVASDREVLIIVRSKDDASPAQTITLANPSHRLIDYLQNMPPVKSEVRQLDVANFREANAASEHFRQRMQQRR